MTLTRKYRGPQRIATFRARLQELQARDETLSSKEDYLLNVLWTELSFNSTRENLLEDLKTEREVLKSDTRRFWMEVSEFPGVKGVLEREDGDETSTSPPGPNRRGDYDVCQTSSRYRIYEYDLRNASKCIKRSVRRAQGTRKKRLQQGV